MELYSAVGLLFLSLFLATAAVDASGLENIQAKEFWIVSLLALGLLQFIAMVARVDLVLLRTVISFTNGLMWVWISLVDSPLMLLDSSDAAAWMIGIANLYAFVINSTLVKKSWSW